MAKILIVDDSKFQRSSLARKLTSFGHNVIEGNSGVEGLKAIETDAPECILTDLHMPIMDGYEFIKELKKTGCSAPVIVLSADTQTETIEEIKRLGAFGFMTKPFDDKTLQTTIETAILRSKKVS